MKTEEKILNYMDGTLSENESGELLHSLSVSPEKRVVLEQHIKLRELTSFAQKPVAVPSALEASMAERFPAIASYNRELAGGAMIIEQAARPSFIGRMAAAVAAFIAQYPVRTGFAVAAASVIGYFALSGNNSSMVDGRSSIVGEGTTTNNQSSITNNAPPTISKSVETAPAPATFSAKNHSRTDFSPSKQSLERTEVRSTVSQSTPEKLAVTPAEKTPAANNKDLADASNNVAVPKNNDMKSENTITDNTNSAKDIAAITPVTDVPSQNVSLAENNIHGSRAEQNPFKDRDEISSGIPFAVRVYGSLGGSFVNVHQNDATLANRTETAALIGIDYVANPNWSFGVEGGNAAISQLITQSAIQSSFNGLPSISRVVVNNVVTSGSQFYARAVAHYTFNPFDAIHIEGTVGAGMAFASSNAPLVSGALYAGRDLNEHFGISAGLAFAGAWTNANAQNVAVQAIASGTDPIGYVTTNRASSWLFTPSYALRVGLKYRL